MRSLLKDQEAQATTEYILMLSIIMVLLVGLIKKLIKPVMEKLAASLEAAFKNILFGANLHQIRRH